MHWPASKGTLKSQPRLLFSIPYSAALAVLVMPGGKWMPLRKRTVREVSGAWLWLKNAAVRATPTALSSFAFETVLPRKTASGRPARSTTATVTPPMAPEAAARAMASTSALDRELAATPPSLHTTCASGVAAQPAGSAETWIAGGGTSEPLPAARTALRVDREREDDEERERDIWQQA